MHQTLYATRSMKHPKYRGRVLRAGEGFTVDGPTARLYCSLGVATTEAPEVVEDEQVVCETSDDGMYIAIEEKPKRRRRRRSA
jgi:hypothetical protein